MHMLARLGSTPCQNHLGLWRERSVLALALLAFAGVAGCSSSSSSGAADGGLFGNPDTGSSSRKDTGATQKHDTGVTTKHDSGIPPEMKDAACGAPTTAPDWCDLNALKGTEASNIDCEDFDTGGPLNGDYGYSPGGITRSSWVGGQYVSPFCALRAFIGDAAAPAGAYSFHAYTVVPANGVLSVAADVRVPNSPACSNAVIARVWASPTDLSNNAVMAWVRVTNLIGTGATPTGYTLELFSQAGTRSDGGTGAGSVSSPASVDVVPGTNGWARIQLAATAYSLGSPATIDAVAYWTTAGDVKTETANASPKASASGKVLPGPPDTPGGEADFGIIPDPTTGVPTAGCDLLLDNVVSNLTP